MGRPKKYKAEEFIGKEINGLLCIAIAPCIDRSGRLYERVVFKCQCGAEKECDLKDLASNKIKSCGCSLSKTKTRHGMCGTRRISIYQGMKERCRNPNSEYFYLYGGRGITFCPEWNSTEQFLEDMLPTYFDGAYIDRIDNDLGYFKENCRWVTPSMSAHNKRKMSGRSSKYIGVNRVVLESGSIRWHVGVGGQYVASCLTEIEAAIAADNASEEMYGDRPNNTERCTDVNI